MKFAGLLAGAALAIVALAVAIGLGAVPGLHLLHQAPQPRMQLTVRLDSSAVPQLLVRDLFEEWRRDARDRIGFAAMAPSGDSVDVTLREGIDRARPSPGFASCAHQPAGGAEEREVHHRRMAATC